MLFGVRVEPRARYTAETPVDSTCPASCHYQHFFVQFIGYPGVTINSGDAGDWRRRFRPNRFRAFHRMTGWILLSLTTDDRFRMAESDDVKPPYIKKLTEYGDLVVWIVDGSFVRTHLDEEFTNFGSHLVFDCIPKNELWLDKEAKNDEQRFFIHHLLEIGRAHV